MKQRNHGIPKGALGEDGSLYPESFSPDLEEEGEGCDVRTPHVPSAFTCASHSMVLARSLMSALFCFSGQGGRGTGTCGDSVGRTAMQQSSASRLAGELVFLPAKRMALPSDRF